MRIIPNIKLPHITLGLSIAAFLMAAWPHALNYMNSPKVSGILNSNHNPDIDSIYLLCLEIENRTKGGVRINYGGVAFLGPGDSEVFGTLDKSSCSSMKAVTTDGLSITPVDNFDGTAKVSLQHVKPAVAFFSKNLAPHHTPRGSTYIGISAGGSDIEGINNIAVGQDALGNAITGNGNIAIGKDALRQTNGSINNIAIGVGNLSSNTNGYNNTAVGTANLLNATTAFDNSAFGIRALALTTTGSNNTGIGADSFEENTTGERNTGVGVYSGRLSKNSSHNTTVGFSSLYHYDSTLGQNTALGANALGGLKEGGNNVAVGMNAGLAAREATGSTWLGIEAGSRSAQKKDVINSTAIGAGSWTDENNQISLGDEEIAQVRMWGYLTLMKRFPADGTGVPINSLFLSSDGALSFKGPSGVTRLAQ